MSLTGPSSYTQMVGIIYRLFQEDLLTFPEGWSLDTEKSSQSDKSFFLCNSDFPECSIYLKVWNIYTDSRDVVGHVKGIAACINVPIFEGRNFKSLIKTPGKIGTPIPDPLRGTPMSEIAKKVSKLIEKAVRAVEAYMSKYAEMKEKKEEQRTSWEIRLKDLGEIPERVVAEESGAWLQLRLFVTDKEAKEVLQFLRTLREG